MVCRWGCRLGCRLGTQGCWPGTGDCHNLRTQGWMARSCRLPRSSAPPLCCRRRQEQSSRRPRPARMLTRLHRLPARRSKRRPPCPARSCSRRCPPL
eukprot:1345675-Rhodomonas_salina.1